MKLNKLLIVPFTIGGITPLISISSCNQSSICITFEGCEGVQILNNKPITVNKNIKWKNVIKPNISVDNNYYFEGWEIDGYLLKDDDIIENNITIKAKAFDKRFQNDLNIDYDDTNLTASIFYYRPQQAFNEDIEIPPYCFKDGKSYKTINISPNFFAEDEGKNVVTAKFPYTLTEFSNFRFVNLKLQQIMVDKNNPIYGSIDETGNESNCIYEKGTNTLLFSFDLNNTPKFITKIGQNAFKSFIKYDEETDLVIPDQIEEIGPSAFAKNNFKSVVFPKNLKMISDNAFSDCIYLQSVQFKCDEVNFGNNVFTNDYSLNNVALPKNNRTLAPGLFGACVGLSDVILPEKLETINSGAFSSCSNLVEITIPPSLKKIGTNAFADSGLRKIFIPKSVEQISPGIFSGCKYLNEIKIDPENAYFSSQDTHGNEFNCILKKDTKSLFYSLASIPEGTVTVENGALLGRNIESINIPDGVQTLKDNALSCCSNLKTITIGKDLNSISESSFYDDKSRENITIDPNNKAFTSQGNSSDECNAMMNADRTKLFLATPTTVLLDSITHLEKFCYSFLRDLKTFTLTKNLEFIGNFCFYDSGIETLTFNNDMNINSTIGESSFSSLLRMKTIYFNLSLTSWPINWNEDAFYPYALSQGDIHFPDKTTADIVCAHWKELKTWNIIIDQK